MGSCHNSNRSSQKQQHKKTNSPKTIPFIIKDDISKYYKILPTLLGKGSSSKVFKCIHIATQQSYAVKRVRKTFQWNIPSLIKEIEISFSLSHCNIIKYHEVYEDRDYFSIVMEFFQGVDLFTDIIKQQTSTDLEDNTLTNLRIMLQILNAVNYIHSEGYIHRDIKPGNIMIHRNPNSSTPKIKIIDFGFTKKIVDNTESLLKKIGTAVYNAPEQIIYGNNAMTYNEKIDIWAVGWVCYNWFSGSHPFSCKDGYMKWKQQILNTEFTCSFIKNRKLRTLIQGMLAKNADKRFDGVRAVNEANEIIIEELKNMLEGTSKLKIRKNSCATQITWSNSTVINY